MLSQLPYQQTGHHSPSVYGNIQSFHTLNYSDVPGSLIGNQQFPSVGASLQGFGSIHGIDPNSPEAFKQNMQLIQGHVIRVQNLARSALGGIEHAYHPGTNPIQTASDVAALKQALQALEDILRQTGVGALPLQASNSPGLPTEDQLISDTTRSIQVLYERYKCMQESSGVVASLLNVGGEQSARR
ncbi:hypothetical protein AcW1_010096 [Taiwanofungus camphoratus]|nr:hypothetical protein AcV5_002990 [Antrodia cinnamomea]KAI0946704.1 hypothetical protein AcW1_010096 [Antrodia cinnamomea]KAI0954219.1 hypothetical protein AcV7_007511 [Antrodia cinnamomea]